MVKSGKSRKGLTMRINVDVPRSVHKRLKLEAVRRGVLLGDVLLERLASGRSGRRVKRKRRRRVRKSAILLEPEK